MKERDNLFRKHPKTTFVAAHMGWHANDLGRLGKMLDEMPNVYTEVGAVLYDIGRQPRAAHDFFVKYQDRILFGKDSFQPEEYPYYWRVFETRDDYFDYYRGYHAFWKLYGIDLPDAVLKKVYYKNALRITAGCRRRGAKVRLLFAVPHGDESTFVYGANFEFSYNAKRWNAHRITSEVRGIVGWHVSQAVEVILNPIFDTAYDGVRNLDFAPSARLAYHRSAAWSVAAEEYSDFGAIGRFARAGRSRTSSSACSTTSRLAASRWSSARASA